jgi:cyanophycinase
VAVYQSFVDQANLRKPQSAARAKILVVTASSRDPFEVADFYEGVFQQAGAEVEWLPLDRNYQVARALESLGQKGCAQLEQIRGKNNSYYREHIYPKRAAKQQAFCEMPQRMLDALSQAQGIFFNGGDQSLTLASLLLPDGRVSPELSLIKQRMQSGDLIVGGTSAGTAVQAGGVAQARPVAMISNGDPSQVMSRGVFASEPPSERCLATQSCPLGVLGSDVTYRSQGGSGLFNSGLLDTHFSERERETRLIVLSAETKQSLGFGVDEATALLVGRGDDDETVTFKVVGENGVFITDQRHGEYHRQQQSGKLQVTVAGLSHYLTAGSSAQWNKTLHKWQFSLAGNKVSKTVVLPALTKGQWRNQVRAACGSTQVISWQQFGNIYELSPNTNSQFHQTGETHCSYVNLPFSIRLE